MHPNFYFHETFIFTAQLVLLPRLPDTKFTPPTITMIVGRILVDYSVYYGVSNPRTRNILSLCKVTHCAGRVSANTRPHQLRWGDREMGTAIISCVECSQVAGLIQKVGRDSSKSTVSSCSCPSCSCPSCSCLSFEDLAYAVRARVAIVIVDRHVLSVRKRCVRARIRKYWRHLKYKWLLRHKANSVRQTVYV